MNSKKLRNWQTFMDRSDKTNNMINLNNLSTPYPLIDILNIIIRYTTRQDLKHCLWE